ncbi:MAG: hypothetical protein HOC74_44525 [Gemmatimonadetes bacterium]|jgi:hypothetical protein|nr:hypothetical protein [Gemmatimonadota bacterium]
MMRIFSLGFFVICLAWTPGGAQTLRLQSGSSTEPIQAQVGDTVEVEVWANLDSLATSGIALFVSLPLGVFEVVDNGMQGQDEIQPFIHGSLFAGAMVGRNAFSSLPDIVSGDRRGMEYAVIFGPEEPRSVVGGGVVASFEVVCREPLVRGEIEIEDDPIRETRIVLSDGTTERRFISLKGLEFSVEEAPTAVAERAWGEVKTVIPRP